MALGGVNATVADALPAVATTLKGMLGWLAGVMLFEDADGRLEPAALNAFTVNV